MSQRIKIGKNMEKILLFLTAGMIISLSKSPTKTFLTLKKLPRELEKINKRHLNMAINKLYESKLVDIKYDENGNEILIITEKGKSKVKHLSFDLDKIKFRKEEKWDGQWRIIIYDLPNNLKKERNTLQFLLKAAGAYQLQKSVYIYPYDCKEELDYIIESLNIRRYVRFVLANDIDNSLHIKQIFNLI